MIFVLDVFQSLTFLTFAWVALANAAWTIVLVSYNASKYICISKGKIWGYIVANRYTH